MHATRPKTLVEKIFELYEHDQILRNEHFKLLDDFSSHVSKISTMLAASGYTADSEMLWSWFVNNGHGMFPKN